jgi:hypothetical protein
VRTDGGGREAGSGGCARSLLTSFSLVSPLCVASRRDGFDVDDD